MFPLRFLLKTFGLIASLSIPYPAPGPCPTRVQTHGGNTRLIAVILGAESAGIRSQEVRRLVEAGFKSRTKGITVASALTKYKPSSKATASSVKKQKIRRDKATAQASRRTGRS